ncbi:uncharacterized protein EI97DRAFT_462600 [Westerdykella ornata]|uniref:C2H2-type domain-containing protein n=1 Tax=Westerdykella ornata TaxID=318751 RepID=A0A6A6J6V4_WESOR|nr:uncharacterized protein EI97DRAFT_462600 [Westerdykella ornata]KAF2271718.1 hypothetical protein EI97DRAFT_462600 [Westerdykella ornata]
MCRYTLRIDILFEDDLTAEEIQTAFGEMGASTRPISGWSASYDDILVCPKDGIILPLRATCGVDLEEEADSKQSYTAEALGLEIMMGYTRPKACSPLALANQRRKRVERGSHNDPRKTLGKSEIGKIVYQRPRCHHCGTTWFDYNSLRIHLHTSHGYFDAKFQRRGGFSALPAVPDGFQARQPSTKFGELLEEGENDIPQEEEFIVVAPTRPFNRRAYLEEGDDSWLREAIRFSSLSKPPIALPQSATTTRDTTRELEVITSDPACSSVTTPGSGRVTDTMAMDVDETSAAAITVVGKMSRVEEGGVEMKNMTAVSAQKPAKQRVPSSLHPSTKPVSLRTPTRPTAPHISSNPNSIIGGGSTTVTFTLDQLSIAETTDIETVTPTSQSTNPSTSQGPNNRIPLERNRRKPHRILTVPHSSTTFFHPLTSRPLIPGEPLPPDDNDEDENDMPIVDMQSIHRIQSNPRLTDAQKAFLTLYNPFMRRERVGGACHLPGAMVQFARWMVAKGVFGSGGRGEEVWSEFRKLLGEFCEAGLLGKEVVGECEGVVLEALGGREN